MFADLRPAFPMGPSVCLGGGGGGGQQASSLSSKHKLWNFHRHTGYSGITKVGVKSQNID